MPSPLGGSSPIAVISLLLAVLAAMAVLYLARPPCLRLLRTTAVALATLLRRLRRRVIGSRTRAHRRLRTAVVAEARRRELRAAEVERRRLNHLIDRDLAELPSLQRRIVDELQQVDEEYRSSIETPPAPPRWLEAVESVAALRGHDDPSVVRVLEEMHATLDRSCHETLRQHRQASQRRHRLLGALRARLQRIEVLFGRIERSVARLSVRTRHLDQHLEQVESLQRVAAAPARTLAAHVSARLAAALVGLAIILAAAYVEFHLLRRPLEELGQAGGTVPGPLAFRDQIVAAVLGSLALLGWLGLELAGYTRLLPALGAADSRLTRPAMTGLSTLIALLLASVAGLAWTRDYLLAQDLGVETILAGGQVALPITVALAPALAQSVISVVFGLLVALAALPLETLLRDGRLALRALWLGALRLLVVVIDLLALVTVHGARLLIALYDVVVFLPLALERRHGHAPRPVRDQPPPARQSRQAGDAGDGVPGADTPGGRRAEQQGAG